MIASRIYLETLVCRTCLRWPQDAKHEKRVAVASSCNVLVFEVVELDGLDFREEHAFSTSGVTTIGFPDEATSDNLCLGYVDGTIRIYSCVKSFTLLQKLTNHRCEITVIASSQDYLIIGDAEGVISVTQKPEQGGDGWSFVKKEAKHPGSVVSLVVDRCFAYSISTDLYIRIWAHPSLVPISTIDCEVVHPPSRAEAVNLQRLLVVERPTSRWGLQGSIRGTDNHPGGMLFAVGERACTEEGVLLEYNLAKNEWTSASVAHEKCISTMVFGPYDNGPLITATVDGTIDMWKWSSGEMICKTLGEVVRDGSGPTALVTEPQRRLYTLSEGILAAWWWRD
eukprot:GEMP01021178.1.p1 GENE.GEMP01021178.1~~GEMP01021178.1.p1  ORF type:complete len:339 (+),score=50.77 GEMP01021178.1:327-1343(+)